MIYFTLILNALIFINQSMAAEVFETIHSEGYVFHNKEKIIANVPLKVGSLLTAKGDVSFIDVNFKNAFFRLVNGSLEVVEGNFQKGSRDVLRMEQGKGYFYLDKTFSNNLFQLNTPDVILSVAGNALSKPTKFYVFQTKEMFRIFMLKGHIEITIPKVKKQMIIIKDGQYFEYDGKNLNQPTVMEDARKIQKIKDVFSKFTPPHNEDTIYVHESKREMLKL